MRTETKPSTNGSSVVLVDGGSIEAVHNSLPSTSSSSSSSATTNATNTNTTTTTSSSSSTSTSTKSSSPISTRSLSNSSSSTTTSMSKPTTRTTSSISCSTRKCFISVWSTWYCLLIVSLHIYLIKNRLIDILAIRSCTSLNSALNCVLNNTFNNQTRNFNSNETNSFSFLNELNLDEQAYFEFVTRLCLLVLSILFLILFLISSLKQIGNYANDGVKFGRDFFREKFLHNHSRLNYRLRSSTQLASAPTGTVANISLKPSNDNNKQNNLKSDPNKHQTDKSQTNGNDDYDYNDNDISYDENCQNTSVSSLPPPPISSSKKQHQQQKQRHQQTCSKSISKLIEVVCRHFLPVNSFCHLMSILLLIFSQAIFKSNFNLSQSSLAKCSAASTSSNSNKNSRQLISCIISCLLSKANMSNPVVVGNGQIYNSGFLIEQIIDYKIELISILLALVSIYIRYGSVFWFTNKFLSFLITFIGFIAAIEQLFQIYSFIYIINQLNLNYCFYVISNLVSSQSLPTLPGSTQIIFDNFTTSLMPLLSLSVTDEISRLNGMTSSTTTSSGPTASNFINNFFDFTFLIRSKFTLLFLNVTLSFLVYLSATPAYVFAFLKYKERFMIEESLFLRTILNNKKVSNDVSIVSSHLASIPEIDSDVKAVDSVKTYATPSGTNNTPAMSGSVGTIVSKSRNEIVISTCCFNYCPHLIATIQLVLICACKLPFCYDYIIYFNKYKDFGIMLVIIIEILHTIILIFIWLLLTLKTDWNMHLQTAFSICHWTYHLRAKEQFDLENKEKSRAKLLRLNNNNKRSYKMSSQRFVQTISENSEIKKQMEMKNSNCNYQENELDNYNKIPFKTMSSILKNSTNVNNYDKSLFSNNCNNNPRQLQQQQQQQQHYTAPTLKNIENKNISINNISSSTHPNLMSPQQHSCNHYESGLNVGYLNSNANLWFDTNQMKEINSDINNDSLSINGNNKQNASNNYNIMIRNNNVNSTGTMNSKRKINRNFIETKHKSLIEKPNEIEQLTSLNEMGNSKSQLISSSDYLLNSETLYRNEIRKSIRNILQQKRCASAASNTTTSATSSMAQLLNPAAQVNNQSSIRSYVQTPSQIQIEPTSATFYYQTDPINNNKPNIYNQNTKRLIGGVYLTSTTPTIIDTTSMINSNQAKVPTITTILTSTICATKTLPPASTSSSSSSSMMRKNNSFRGDSSILSDNHLMNHSNALSNSSNNNRQILYLERAPSSEYESRV